MLSTLSTPRLILRPFRGEDADHLVELNSDAAVMEWLNGGIPLTRANVEQVVLPAFLQWNELSERFGFRAVIEKSSGLFVGWIHFRPPTDPQHGEPSDIELGYRLRRSAWGQGFATEGSRELLRVGFEEWNVPRVTASAMRQNVASIKVMQKLGMQFVGTFEEHRFPGPDKTAELYAITQGEWRRSNQTSRKSH